MDVIHLYHFGWIGSLMVFSANHFLVKRSQSVIWKEYPFMTASDPTIKSHGPNF